MAKEGCIDDRAITLYDPVKHRSLATQFGQDPGMSILSHRSQAVWFLGYPEAALADVERALARAREVGHAATLMYALWFTSVTQICCGNYATANALIRELVLLSAEKDAVSWRAFGTALQGSLLAITGRASDAIPLINSGMTALRATGATIYVPLLLSHLTLAYAEVGHFEDAWRSADEAEAAVQKTGERWFEAEVHRVPGEVALKSTNRDAAKAETHFDRALAVARKQQAKSWELRAAMSMARLWRDQGRRDEARELLAPVYGWFTEGVDTLDLKEAKALLDELAA